MRVAVVCRRFNLRGSIERDAVALVRLLTRAGVDVECFGDAAGSDADLGGANLHDIPVAVRGTSRARDGLERASFALRATRELRRRRETFDLVHVCATDAWEHDVVTVHQVVAADQWRWPDQAGKDFRAAHTRAFLAPVLRPGLGAARVVQRLQLRTGRFSRLIAVAPAIRDDLVETFGIPADRIEVVPPYVDVAKFGERASEGVRARLGIAPHAPVLLFVGHDFERKGLDRVVRALADLPGAHLAVVGGGDWAKYERLAQTEGVSGLVHFAGAVDDPSPWYAAADVFVLPTQHDPWGIAIVEAMAAGVPVVTTMAAGASAFLGGSEAGIVLREASSVAVSNAIRGLIADPKLRKVLGDRGSRAARTYANGTDASPFLRIYDKVFAERNAERKRVRAAA